MARLDEKFSLNYLEEYLGKLKGVCLILTVDELCGFDVSGEVLIKSLWQEPYRASFYKPFDNEVEAFKFKKMLLQDLGNSWLFESCYAYLSGEDMPMNLLGPEFQKLPEEFEELINW